MLSDGQIHDDAFLILDMRPEMFLIGNLKCIWIFFGDAFEDSFILDEIHTTSRVDHLTFDFKCYDRCIDEFFLEASYGLNIFDMPVFRRVCTLK